MDRFSTLKAFYEVVNVLVIIWSFLQNRLKFTRDLATAPGAFLQVHPSLEQCFKDLAVIREYAFWTQNLKTETRTNRFCRRKSCSFVVKFSFSLKTRMEKTHLYETCDKMPKSPRPAMQSSPYVFNKIKRSTLQNRTNTENCKKDCASAWSNCYLEPKWLRYLS